MGEGSLYDIDLVAWSEQQVEELRRLARTAPSNTVDWENVIEEVDSVGKSQVSAVRSKLRLILLHLIELISAPDAEPRHHWRAEIVAFQDVAAVECTRTMRRLIDLQGIWDSAKREAGERLAAFGQRPSRRLPTRCPFTIDDLVDKTFDVDRALNTLGSAIAHARD